jgi:hypothetical protein
MPFLFADKMKNMLDCTARGFYNIIVFVEPTLIVAAMGRI